LAKSSAGRAMDYSAVSIRDTGAKTIQGGPRTQNGESCHQGFLTAFVLAFPGD